LVSSFSEPLDSLSVILGHTLAVVV
jgi:hypothetical protein